MDSVLSKLPSWVIAVLLVYVAFLVSYAVYDNRKVDLWPPTIHSKGSDKGGEEVIGLPQQWQITEEYGWTGDWVIPSFGTEFPCSWKHSSGAVITAKCIVVKSANFYAVRRFNVSDGNPCNYFGVGAGNTISGKYFCSNGGPYEWSAKIP